jgi:uncharacterized repeat protein (TIGR01451 family)
LLLTGLALAAPAQTITNIVPRYGSAGDIIDIFGNGFNLTTRVRFNNGTSAQVSPTAASDNQLSGVAVPGGVTTGYLTVQNTGGNQNPSGQTFTVIGPGPHITDFFPSFGPVGETVLINGVHFSNAIDVRFGSRSADFNVQNNGNQITAFVPFGATNAPISVITAFGTSNSPTAFTVIGPGPYISFFTPAGAAAGSPVTIHGQLLNSGNPVQVRFGGSPPTSVNIFSSTEHTMNVPANAVTGPISVSNALGGSISSSIFYVPPAPTNFVPSFGRAGTNVVIRGTSLNGVTAVSFNGQPATFSVSGSTQIVATVPELASTGKIMLQNAVHTSVTTSNFVVPPTIISFTPNFGPPPTSVTITGLNLLGSTAVKFGNVTATTVVATNQTRIFAHVPAAAVTAPLSVTTTNGTNTTLDNFFIPARILDFTPTNGSVGTLVTLTGENFLGATAVAFAGTGATFTPPTNNTTLRANIPSGIVTGPISVTTPAGMTNSAKIFYGPPLVFGFAPASGLPGTNVVVTGTNFIAPLAVSFNGVAATFTVTNLGRLGAVVPGGATTGPITVANASGSHTTLTNFTLEFLSDLKLTLTDAPDPVTLRSNLVYTVALTNTGPFAAANVRLTNTLPAGVNLVSATTTFPGSLTTGPVIIANPGTLGLGAGGTLTITVSPQNLGMIVNQAGAGSDFTDPVLSNNIASISTYVEPAALLSILRQNPASVRVAWPVELTNHALQFSPNLTASNFWSNIAATPQIIGTQRVVIEPHTNATRLYRLRR